MKSLFLLLTFTVLFTAFSFAQNISINNDASAPNASAMLDVKNPNKGMLVPRVTLTGTNDVVTIPSPATSLLVYNTTSAGSGGSAVTPGYYYWNGTAWAQLATSSSSVASGTAWLITGNSGTADGTNFIGTVDNVPLTVKVNNQRAGRIDGTPGNSFWGYNAGLALTNGQGNSAIGYQSLFSITTGNKNTANGAYSLYSNTTGFSNVAIVDHALAANTTSSNLVAIGDSALLNNTNNQNTAIGSKALYSNTTGTINTANGIFALYSNINGNYNTANGYQALLSNISGNNNTALGYGANVSAGNLTNATVIGADAMVNASNKVRIGNTSVTVIEGQVAFSSPSDKRFKYNIQNNVPGLDFIKKLTPVTYFFDEEKLNEYTKTGIINNAILYPAVYIREKQLHTGFLAQDVESIAKELGYDFDGVHAPANERDHYSLAYSQFIMPLVKSVQQQQEIIETQKNDIDILKAQVAELSRAVKKLTAE